MKIIQIHILALCFLCLMPNPASTTKTLPYLTFAGTSPAGYHDLGVLPAGTKIKAITRFYSSAIAVAGLKLIVDETPTVIDTSSKRVTTDSTFSFEHTVTQAGHYFVFTLSSSVLQFSFQIFINEALIKNGVLSTLSSFNSHKITTQNACRVRIVFSLSDGASLERITIKKLTSVLNPSPKKDFILDLQPGDLYLTFLITNPQPTYQLSPYTLSVYSYCDNLCVNPALLSQPVCYSCGNAILEEGENCDNGNRLGCSGCEVVQGYECLGNYGGSSLCSKQPNCGDGVVDQGEECDNGNRQGCSLGCKKDAGYNCTAVAGSPSSCSLCGNGIVEGDEQCDNQNSVGCSSGCKVDAGFECRGVNSACFRKNPVCGNNLVEIGQSCDDGNSKSGDGCSQFCLVEKGYSCSGGLGGSSKCSLAAASVCGNSIFEPNTEQCDNGNQPGCFNCVIQRGYECTNKVGSPSVCLSKILTPHCGNGVFEPATGEVCDDGNVLNGDGCNYFCQVEFGWVCLDNTKCRNLQDPQLKVFCGNGKRETKYGEDCDDGNKIEGDGCNGVCKIESGWSCTVYGVSEGRSYCSRSGYCGNGVVEGLETCDDGFPLKNGDGCSTQCRIEAGWNCQQSHCWRI